MAALPQTAALVFINEAKHKTNGATKGGWDGKRKEPGRNWTLRKGVFSSPISTAEGRLAKDIFLEDRSSALGALLLVL